MSLPSGYKRLEYIQSSGTQYIDTGFKPNQDTRVTMDAELASGTGNIGLFGARVSANSNNYALAWIGSYFRSDYNTAYTQKWKVSQTARRIYDKNKETSTIDGVSQSYINKTFQVPVNLALLANNQNGRIMWFASAKLYSCQIYDNGTLVRDFVPCINASGEVGLYDLVGKQFYGNAGSGTFRAGPVIAIAADKSEITKLEYIQSSGTQYINTGFKPNNNTRVVMDLLYTGNESISNEFGAWNSSNNASFICLTTGKNNLYPFYGNTSKQVSANRTVRHTVDMDKNVVKMNGTTMITFNQMSFQCIYPMFLCCFNNVGATENMTSMRIYFCQIYDNGTLVRDYIPCQTTAGEIGLWDDVNSVLYGNAGTGTFEAGPVIAIAIDNSEITELEYIQGSGTQYINTGIMPNQDTRLDLQASFAQTGSHTIVGADLGWTANGFSIGVGFAHYGTETSNINGMNDGLMHLISMNKNTLSVDGVSVHVFSAQTFFVGYPLVLFANNRNGSIEEITTMTLCSSQIYDNGTIVRNYIPCQTSSGEIGLWDALNKMFYRNVGTGTFTAGPIKVSPLNLPVNIGGTWKNANEVFVNIGGTWKTVESAFVSIGGTWKELG